MRSYRCFLAISSVLLALGGCGDSSVSQGNASTPAACKIHGNSTVSLSV